MCPARLDASSCDPPDHLPSLHPIPLHQLQQLLVDPPGERRPLVDQRGVDLHQRGAGAQAPVGLGSRIDPSDADQHGPAEEAPGHGLEHAEALLPQHPPGQPAEVPGPRQQRVVGRGVRGHDRRPRRRRPPPRQRPAAAVRLQVRGDLHQHRLGRDRLRPAPSTARTNASFWRSRSPGVLGEERFTTR